MDRLVNIIGKAALVAARCQAPDENTLIEEMAAHADAVAKESATRERAGWIDRKDANFFLCVTQLGGDALDEAAFAGAHRAGEPDHMSAPGPRVKPLENFLRPLLSVLDPSQHLSRGAR